MTIFNANYSLLTTVELQSLGNILSLLLAIPGIRLPEEQSDLYDFVAEMINTTVSCQGDFFFSLKKHSLKLLEIMLVKTGVCNFPSTLCILEENSL